MDHPQRTIRFYFDYISSNAYIAWIELPKLAARHGFTIEPVPVLFAGLLNAHGLMGPAEIPAKAIWMSKNVLRKAVKLGVPLNAPAFHPFNPLLSLRVSGLPLEPEPKRTLISALFDAVWVRGLHVSEVAVVEQIGDEIGLGGAALVAEAQSDEAKARLRQDTDDAIARGVFGVPTMEVDGEIFWGYDDFPYLEPFLEGKDLLERTEWKKWAPPQASAVRRRR
jgi:2-hydroxychromene-2-carboxylate isomerase